MPGSLFQLPEWGGWEESQCAPRARIGAQAMGVNPAFHCHQAAPSEHIKAISLVSTQQRSARGIHKQAHFPLTANVK